MQKKKIYLQKIRKAEYRKRSIFYITKYLGKGINTSLSKVKIVDLQYNESWYYNKNNIENKIINYSK